jgi:arginase
VSHKDIYLIGYASDVAGANAGSGEGAQVLKDSSDFALLSRAGLTLTWEAMLRPDLAHASILIMVHHLCKDLSTVVAKCVTENKFFTVFGGDHSCAIGTWSGVSYAKKEHSPIGLIWIDAHLDSHTPQTSDTGNIHGMPLAALLGYGDLSLSQLYHTETSLKPENICVIGVRSFEPPELELLSSLNVRIFFMEEVAQRGMNDVMQEAIEIVTRNTSCFGVTIDVDSIDPIDAPGTGVAEANGIPGEELCQALTLVANDKRLIGAEIVEFDPSRDKNGITEKLITRMLTAITVGQLS